MVKTPADFSARGGGGGVVGGGVVRNNNNKQKKISKEGQANMDRTKVLHC